MAHRQNLARNLISTSTSKVAVQNVQQWATVEGFVVSHPHDMQNVQNLTSHVLQAKPTEPYYADLHAIRLTASHMME